MYYITASYMYSYYSLLPVLQPLTRITASYPYSGTTRSIDTLVAVLYL